MRVLQLIDSLEAGGAERMAVNLSNALASKVERSYICATRQEGLLKASIHKDVLYLFLKKRHALDLVAVLRMYRFLKRERITIIHAHSSSYFLAVLVTRLLPQIKVIWHDHYGNSQFLVDRPTGILRYCSRYFSHSFGVNNELVKWARNHLKHDSLSYLANFINMESSKESVTELKGKTGKRIVCLANLRPQKDHLNLLLAFNEILKEFPAYSLHCVGQDFGDAYSKEIYEQISNLKLSTNVFFYGTCPDISAILAACDIGVLSSKSEGLPLALLEYGRAGLPVVVTNVGDCALVVQDKLSGLVVAPEDYRVLYSGLRSIILNSDESQKFGLHLKQTIANKYATSAVIDSVLKRYEGL